MSRSPDRRSASRGDDRSDRGDDRDRNDDKDSRGGNLDDQLDKFIDVNRIDSSAEERLRRCDKETQEKVLDMGFDITSVRNPSAIVMSRISTIERGGKGGGGRRGGRYRSRSRGYRRRSRSYDRRDRYRSRSRGYDDRRRDRSYSRSDRRRRSYSR